MLDTIVPINGDTRSAVRQSRMATDGRGWLEGSLERNCDGIYWELGEMGIVLYLLANKE